jgi:DNA-binding winged helix-turn-helix (wHTH) protein
VRLVGDTAVRGAYRFGPFSLNVRERRLSRGDDVIPLRLKVFDTLVVLVENAGRLVTKQELLDTVWPETTVEENNLNHNVSVLRKALGEKATGQQYIETVPRVGYRFAGLIDAAVPQTGASPLSTASVPTSSSQVPTKRDRRSATARRATVSGSPMPRPATGRRS